MARKALLPRLPLEVVRRRVARARELGRAYPHYASILLGSGRDILGFLFTCDALALRLARSLDLPRPVAEKLASLARCDRLLLTEPTDDPESLARQFADAAIPLAGAGNAPPAGAGLPEGGRAVRAVLDPLKLPSGAIVMVGTRARERDWAAAARVAKLLSAETYFDEAR